MTADRYIDIEVRGIPVVFDAAAMDDFRVMRLLRKLENPKNSLMVCDLAEKLLGEEQLENVMASLEEDGICKSSDMVPFVFECINAAAEAKGGELKN